MTRTGGVVVVAMLACATPPSQAGLSASAPTVEVTIRSGVSRRLAPGFAGYNVALMESTISYRDPALASATAALGPGWLRFPAGMRSDAFDWRTGLSPDAWAGRFANSEFGPQLRDAQRMLELKGGEHIADASRLVRAVGAAGLVVCVNVFTDTPESAGEFAAYARATGIRVLAWELGNEPTFFPDFFPNASTYAARMRPFADAIRAADPAARVALSMSIAGLQDESWDDDLAAFRPRYWDLIAYHDYHRIVGTSSELIARLNEQLLRRSAGYVTSEVTSRFGEMPVVVTEVRPDREVVGTLYGGIWAAEFALRLSAVPSVERVGMHQLLGPAGIETTNNYLQTFERNHVRGASVPIATLDYGLFASAQAVAYAVAASAINQSTSVYRTTLVGGARLPLAGGRDSISGVHAQAFGGDSGRELVLTNKGPSVERVRILFDGGEVTHRLRVVSATGPSAMSLNSRSQANVRVRQFFVRGTVGIPAYSVTRVSW